MSIQVDNKKIGLGHPCFLVAEIGINHNGDMGLALAMIDAAVEAGADGVKFQNYETKDFILNTELLYTYSSQGKKVTESQFDMFKRCELSEDQLLLLKEHCKKHGVVFFSTPTSMRGVQLLVELGVPVLKNGSDYLVHLELVAGMGATGLPTVLSTGMASAEEIDEAVQAFRAAGGRDLILLHCTSSYPTPPGDVNLRSIPTLANEYGCAVGLSDHSQGTLAAVGAVALGACMVEKHFTLDRSLPGPDQWFSSDPQEFRNVVNNVRAMEKLLGKSSLGLTESELEGRESFRLSCVASRDLVAEQVLKREDIAFCRPGTGVPPKMIDRIVGRAVKSSVKRGAILRMEELA